MITETDVDKKNWQHYNGTDINVCIYVCKVSGGNTVNLHLVQAMTLIKSIQTIPYD